jgi:hypothetical protein
VVRGNSVIKTIPNLLSNWMRGLIEQKATETIPNLLDKMVRGRSYTISASWCRPKRGGGTASCSRQKQGGCVTSFSRPKRGGGAASSSRSKRGGCLASWLRQRQGGCIISFSRPKWGGGVTSSSRVKRGGWWSSSHGGDDGKWSLVVGMGGHGRA